MYKPDLQELRAGDKQVPAIEWNKHVEILRRDIAVGDGVSTKDFVATPSLANFDQLAYGVTQPDAYSWYPDEFDSLTGQTPNVYPVLLQHIWWENPSGERHECPGTNFVDIETYDLSDSQTTTIYAAVWPAITYVRGGRIPPGTPVLLGYKDSRWWIIDGCDQFVEGKILTGQKLYTCSSAYAVSTAGYRFQVYDDFDRVRHFWDASWDENGAYLPEDTKFVCRWIPDRQHWVLFFPSSPGRSPSTSFWALITGVEEVIPEQRWRYTCWTNDVNGGVAGLTFEAKNVHEHYGDWYVESFYPVPRGTRVRVWKSEWIEEGQHRVEYWFSYPLRPVGASATMRLLGWDAADPQGPLRSFLCWFYKGHLRYAIPGDPQHIIQPQQQPGPINVGGNLVPGDPIGRFFPVPGLWNGMPQWQNAQNPNWWIRWIGQPGNGRWAIGQWPQNAQQGDPPEKGFAQNPPQPGQPPNENPIGDYSENIGDAEGTPQTASEDYFLHECNDQSGQAYYRLVGSAALQLPLGRVVKWIENASTSNPITHCGIVEDPDLPIISDWPPRIADWKIVGAFNACNQCGADIVVSDCTYPQVKHLLQGSGSLNLQPGQTILWVKSPGSGFEELLCGKVEPLSSHWNHDCSPGAWAFLKQLASCEECPPGECPSQPSCPSYPGGVQCPEYCPCVEVVGLIQPAEALGVYTVQGVHNDCCWWKKGNWGVWYTPAQSGGGNWCIANLQNAEQYWKRWGTLIGAYLPRMTGETQGIAAVIYRH